MISKNNLSLKSITEKLSNVGEQQAQIVSLLIEVNELKEILKEKDKVICALERRLDDLEQYMWSEEVIINGLETKHQTYARATAASTGEMNEGENAPADELQTLERQVITYLASKSICVKTEDISACYVLPRKNRTAKPAIIVRFVSRRNKAELLRQARKLKGTGVYINEHLTKKNADIARQAQSLWKQNNIQATWSRNGRVMIRLNGTPEEARVIVVREVIDLEKFK